MDKVLLIGANSGIAQALQDISDKEFIPLSRSADTLNLEGDLSELDDLGSISGLVYFPGTINLKPFTMLKEEDYLNDFNINVLEVTVIKKVINNLKEGNGGRLYLSHLLLQIWVFHIMLVSQHQNQHLRA